MKQGEIYWAILDPTQGNEQKGSRPILIISGNSMNANLNLIIACPLSTALKNYPGSIFLPKTKENGLMADSEVITFQIRTLSKTRLTEKIGSISQGQLREVIKGLNEVLIY